LTGDGTRDEGSDATLVVLGDEDGFDGQPEHERSHPLPELESLRLRVEDLEVENMLLEDQVRQLHRVKTVMDLLAGVAHDLSNALTGIVWCAEAVQRRLTAMESDLSAGLSDFVTAAEYARKLARRLLTIGKQRDGSFEPCKLHDVVRDAAELVDTLRPHTATLVRVFEAPDLTVWGNAEQLQQVIVNLATNAFDAVGASGGTVHVMLDELRVMGDAQQSHWARIRVRDTGHGMSADVLKRAFEPFFTTKGAHDGNGLGLVVVKTIVERHRGRMRAHSTVGRGTTIEVLLPVSDDAAL
jgi:two-component system cell cycle sensor histidine kinase/response regulator CckA